MCRRYSSTRHLLGCIKVYISCDPPGCHQRLPLHVARPPWPAGPSGAGKSTLLNALACRLDKGATMEGKARLNGQAYSLAHLKRMASYVMQVRRRRRRARALCMRAPGSPAPLLLCCCKFAVGITA